jgi:phosphatidylglycerophosphatase A
MNNRFVKWLATGFGFGMSPVMPGTVGTLWGIPLFFSISGFSLSVQILLCLVFTLLAVPLCAKAEALIGKGKDPGCIVADEYLTLPIVYLGLPLTPWVVLAGFVFHRIFDITKPPPIRQLQRIKGGAGIVIDDFMAALLALACNHLLF